MFKITRFLSFIFVLGAFFMISCENEPLEGDFMAEFPNDTSDPDNPDDTDTGGGSGEYWPLAIGNTWNFENSESENFEILFDESPLNITGTTNINGQTYYQIPSFISTNSEMELPPGSDATVEDTGGIRFSDGDYSQIIDMVVTAEMQGFSTTMHSSSAPAVFFKESLEAGASWTETMELTMSTEIMGETTTTTQNMDYIFTVVEKDVTVTVNGDTFENVVKMRSDLESDNLRTNFWLAKDVGPIFIEYVDLSTNEWAKREISSYTLN